MIMTKTLVSLENKAWSSAFTAAQKESVRHLGGLLTMELELSRHCDLRCVYCYSEAGIAPVGELSYEEIVSAANQAHALGARRIIILGGGEPLVYPRLLDVIVHIRSLGVQVELFTNGVAMTPALARAFKEMNVSVVLKMNSPRQKVQDALAGRAGTFKAIRRAFELLGEAGYPGNGSRLGAQTVVCRQNLDDLPGMWISLREQEIVPYFETITFQGRARLHPELAVTPDEILTLFTELSRIDRERFGHVWEARPPIAGYTCDRHEYSCTVTSRGFVQPCPGIDLSVGNIREKPLADILRESPVVADLRDVRRRLKGACGECSEKANCYGCRGMAWQSTGDYLAADPMCPKRAPEG
jgi:radical SAM protein with 4Fe4S-binding SPASM domain